MTPDLASFELGSISYPQPIAAGCGRICRARTAQERLDSILKCAEVVTRYLAAVSVSSFGARSNGSTDVPKGAKEFTGNLSWGHFLNLLTVMSGVQDEHPVRPWLVKSIKGKGKKRGVASEELEALLTLRNRLGHNLMGMTEPIARTVFETDAPHLRLQRVLEAVDALLRLPLFLVEEQVLKKKKIVVRRLLLMGESSDPRPEEVEITDGLEHDLVLYIGVQGGVIPLHPLMLWEISQRTANYGVFFVHSVSEKSVRFVTVNDDEIRREELYSDLLNRLAGERIVKETAALAGGLDFMREWMDRTPGKQERATGEVPWGDLDTATVKWYASKMGDSREKSPREIIREHLLDGRENLSEDEIKQLQLLFGTEQTVRKTLRRGMVDLRYREESENRWGDRVESSKNIVESLRTAISFFSRYIGVDGLTLDGLRAASGSADYIAMREGLVNLFIHQDYSDARTVSQVEISKDQALFFNAGYSLVSDSGLQSGSRSQSRNPLISRALRLIGFAELAGSGLRSVREAWRNERRKEPLVESDRESNTFTLTLDWKALPVDEFWQRKLGVQLTSKEAKVLSMSGQRSSVTLEEVCTEENLSADEAEEIIEKLTSQALIVRSSDSFYIREHLRHLVSEREFRDE